MVVESPDGGRQVGTAGAGADGESDTSQQCRRGSNALIVVESRRYSTKFFTSSSRRGRQLQYSIHDDDNNDDKKKNSLLYSSSSMSSFLCFGTEQSNMDEIPRMAGPCTILIVTVLNIVLVILLFRGWYLGLQGLANFRSRRSRSAGRMHNAVPSLVPNDSSF